MDLKSNEPFWLVKNGLLSSFPSLKHEESCDVLVVGGGITGSLIAHQCVEDGYDTVLIDRREICNGSTSATTSMLQYEIDTPLYRLEEMIGRAGAVASYRSCLRAIEQLDALSKRIRSASGFTMKDSLYYAALKKDLPWLQQELEARAGAGFGVGWMSGREIEERYGLHHTYGGIISAHGGSMDAFRMAHELLAYNYKRGLRIYDRTQLETVKDGRGYSTVLTGCGQLIKARKIIYCVGYESSQMIPENFVRLKTTYAIVSEIDKEVCSRLRDTLVWNTADPYLYLRTTDDGRMLIGGGDENFVSARKRDRLLSVKARRLRKAVERMQPDLPFCTDFVWAGTFGETKDGLPYIGTHPAFKHAYFVLGFGGNGITFSVTGMEMVAAWLKGRKHPLSQWFRFGR